MNIITSQFTVHADLIGYRLDAFLTLVNEGGHSRTVVATRIKAGDVTVDGKTITKPSFPVEEGQVVILNIPPPPVFDVVPTPVDFEVVAEEKDFLIINKPAGLSVHHSHTAPEDITLVHGLLHRYPEFASFEDHERPGIVHRLDKNTSGLLVVARNTPALTRLADLFKQRLVKKTYYAIAHGHADREGTIDEPIGRHPTLRHKMAVNGSAPREATTHFKAAAYYEGPYTLLEINLITGRTHQIRVHCASRGLPLVGDHLYGREHSLMKRQALHAGKLAFEYEGKQYSYERAMPTDMQSFIDRLERIEDGLEDG